MMWLNRALARWSLTRFIAAYPLSICWCLSTTVAALIAGGAVHLTLGVVVSALGFVLVFQTVQARRIAVVQDLVAGRYEDLNTKIDRLAEVWATPPKGRKR